MSEADAMNNQQQQQQQQEQQDDGIRFEDLTVDDDLPIMDRIVRYIHSQVALQRLVHVKMLSESSELSGGEATRTHLVPALEDLVADPESVIRQHVAAQLLPIAFVCMYELPQPTHGSVKVADMIAGPDLYPPKTRTYNEDGYRLVTDTIISHLNTLLADGDLDVRRAAATSLSGLALQLRPEDVPTYCLPIPIKFVYTKPQNPTTGKQKSKNEADQRLEELRITSANLLAELGGAVSEHSKILKRSRALWVGEQVLPAVLELCEDPSFRVRRSGVQALPRILGACSFEDVSTRIVPAFERLSQDSVHRIRKSSGECLVDMSRSLMILACSNSGEGSEEEDDEDDEADRITEEEKNALMEIRRTKLIPIADRLIQDPHKMVRQGMMQFLGPFIASFYPYQYSVLHATLPSSTESDGSNHMGIASQFFPHATSMVSRLNSSQNAVTTAPTPVHSSLEQLSPRELSDVGKLKKALPIFIQASRMSNLSLRGVTTHRVKHPPHPDDIIAIADRLLDYFAALAIVSTGDENTDAEMRVYCAYSFPAIVLLLGAENWEGPMKTCFYSLINPNYARAPDQQDEGAEPPLPVKRCLASSLHTVAHVLSPETAASEILPVFQEHFLQDSDDSVRLNVIRNFPSLLSIIPASERKEPFLLWSEVARGEEFLGARKRSATNPLVLNWRQRDYLARSLPELMLLVEPALVHDHLWPILQELITDPVCQVKEDAIWAIPMLLKTYCVDTLQKWPSGMGVQNPKEYSLDCCDEIIHWLKDKILNTGTTPNRMKAANFSDRQMYCRICAAMGMAIRFSQGVEDDVDDSTSIYTSFKDPVSVLSTKFKSLFISSSKEEEALTGPYEKMTQAEEKHLKKLLMDDLIGPALEMQEDRISNVRVTLMKVLQLMPEDIRTSKRCAPVLQNLIEEVETWESFGPEASQPLVPPQQAASSPPERQPKSRPRKQPEEESGGGGDGSGPVDVDITPQSSQDEQDVDQSREQDYDEEEVGPDDAPEPDDDRAEGDYEDYEGADQEEDGEYKTVVFEDGPIGMQLEPTADDRACRVFNFLDASPDNPSPAKSSGKIEIGDVIVSVNGVEVDSYEETITILKAGGRREITFRPGREEDGYGDEDFDYDSQGHSHEEDASSSEGEREKKKKEKKHKKEKKKKEKKKEEKKDKKSKKKKSKDGDDDE